MIYSHKKTTLLVSLTCIVGLSFKDVDLCAVCQPVFKVYVEKAGLGAGHPLQEGQECHRLFTLIPAFEPICEDTYLVSEHHGVSPC